jgi:hypothetical protein
MSEALTAVLADLLSLYGLGDPHDAAYVGTFEPRRSPPPAPQAGATRGTATASPCAFS